MEKDPEEFSWSGTDQGTAVAPEGTAVAPEGTAVAPDGTALAPEPGGGGDSGSGGTTPPPAVDPSLGTLLSSGAEADLYIQKRGSRRIVYKLYRPGQGFDKEVYKRLAPLNKGGYIADILDTGQREDGRWWERMPYYPLGAVSSHGELRSNAEAILAIVVKTALCLDRIHKAGVIHKDVKPANILLVDSSTHDCVLCDFGISDVLGPDGKATTQQSRTPIYAAPEVYAQQTAIILEGQTICELTPAADFYSLGMTILSLWLGEGAFRSKETELAFQKVRGQIPVPPGMPEPLSTILRGLLVVDSSKRWGLEQIEACLRGDNVPVAGSGPAPSGGQAPGPAFSQGGADSLGDIVILFNASKKQTARSVEELSRLMVSDMTLSRKYLYSGRLSQWLSPVPELQTEIDEIVEYRFPRRQSMGLLCAVHTLNPLMDLCLCDDPASPGYAMTGERIGEFLSAVFRAYWIECVGDAKMLPKVWAQDRYAPYNATMPASVVELVVKSFKKYKDSYMELFFSMKGSRFTQQDSWMRHVTDYNSKDMRKRAGPKDADFLEQAAMLRAIKGFGGVPRYFFPETGRTIASLKELQDVPSTVRRTHLGVALRPFIALHYQEDPDADLSPQYSYEKLLEKYVAHIGRLDPSSREYKRFTSAQDEATDMSGDYNRSVRWLRIRSVGQLVIATLLCLLPALASILLFVSTLRVNPVLDTSGMGFGAVFVGLGLLVSVAVFFLGDAEFDGCLTYLLVGFGVSFVVYLLCKFLGMIIFWVALVAAAALVVALVLLVYRYKTRPPGVSSLGHDPDFEQTVLEPLYYAFNNETTFTSSVSTDLATSTLSMWRMDLKTRFWRLLGLTVGAWVLFIVAVATSPAAKDAPSGDPQPEAVQHPTTPSTPAPGPAPKGEAVPQLGDAPGGPELKGLGKRLWDIVSGLAAPLEEVDDPTVGAAPKGGKAGPSGDGTTDMKKI